jgi:sodium-dependent phosphate cotransporter
MISAMARTRLLRRLVTLLLLLYAFFVSLDLMRAAFERLGEGVVEQLLATTSNPIVGLFIGILATSVVQSSSSITSMTVGLVAAGGLDVARAIPIIMGSNVGTSVTNTIVAGVQIDRPKEFRRAMAAGTVDDFFTLISLAVLFPLQLTTNALGVGAAMLSSAVSDIGVLTMVDPVRGVVAPAVALVAHVEAESGILMLVTSLALLFVTLRNFVFTLKGLLIGRLETFFNRTLFKTAPRAMFLGFACTFVVQSSSVTTSLAVPLAGAGVVTLRQVFPYVLGANVGTTFTAILAALVTGEEVALTVAFAHLLFNVVGILIVWPVRWIPLSLAERLGARSARSRLSAGAYVFVVFFVIPLVFIALFR